MFVNQGVCSIPVSVRFELNKKAIKIERDPTGTEKPHVDPFERFSIISS